MADLTNQDFFVKFIGSFWSRILVDHRFSEGIAATSISELVRSYQSLIEAIERLSIDTIKPSVLSKNRPIVFRKSDFSNGPDRVKYAGGQVYGPQGYNEDFRGGAIFEYGGLERRSENFYIGLDDEVVEIGATITNGLLAPSVTLVKGVDFVTNDGIITFRTDPFLNPLITKRLVFSEGVGEEEEIVLWAINARSDNGEFEDQFGFASKGINSKSPNYFEITRSALRAMSGGPSMSLIDHFVASLIGLPCVMENEETVLSISSFRNLQIVATDLNIYKIHSTLEIRDEVVIGATLERGHPLTKGSQIFDSRQNPSWWSVLDGLVLSEVFFNQNFSAAIGFPNKNCVVELSDPEQSLNQEEWRSAKFFISGRQSDVDLFWKSSREFGLQSGIPSGNAIYRYLKIVDENDALDFTRTAIINPLAFIAENVFNSGAIIVKIQSSSLFSLEDFFRGSEILKDLIPPHLGLIIIIDVLANEEVRFQRDDGFGVEPITIEESSTRDILRLNPDNFPAATKALWQDVDSEGNPLTLCPEAFSIDLSPDIGKETVSFGDEDENGVSYGEPTSVCEEFIESANIAICKQ